MSLISVRQLLDHATGHGNGVSALGISGMERDPAVMNAESASDSPAILQDRPTTRSTSAGDLTVVLAAPVPACWFPGIPTCPNRFLCRDEQVRVRVTEAGSAAAIADEWLPEFGRIIAGDECNAGIVFQVVEVAGWVVASIGADPGFLGLPESGEAAEEGADLNGSLAPMAVAA